jgi:hypothetical protein
MNAAHVNRVNTGGMGFTRPDSPAKGRPSSIHDAPVTIGEMKNLRAPQNHLKADFKPMAKAQNDRFGYR